MYQSVLLLCLLVRFSFGDVDDSLKGFCPQGCSCDPSDKTHITCYVGKDQVEWVEQCQEISIFQDGVNAPLNLRLIKHFDSLYFIKHGSLYNLNIACLQNVESLDLSNTSIKLLGGLFTGMTIDSSLNLSANNLMRLPLNTFFGIQYVRSLDLSHNDMTTIDRNMFTDLECLRHLDLSCNNISIIEVGALTNLSNLEYLNLASNKLKTFTFSHFSPNILLDFISLRDNIISNIYMARNISGSDFLHNESLVDVSGNLLECSCNLAYFLEALPFSVDSLVNVNTTLCNSPDSLLGKNINLLDMSGFACSEPNIYLSYPLQQGDVLSTDSITLECHATGYPNPRILWITPWGDHFLHEDVDTHIPSSLVANLNMVVKSSRKYKERNFRRITSIQTIDTGHLVISKIRGSMGGKYTCMAFNPAGNVSKVMELSVYSGIESNYVYSLIFGGYCASGFLIFGFFVGFVRMIGVWIYHKQRFVFSSTTPSITTQGEHQIGSDIACSVSVCGSSAFTAKPLSGAASTSDSCHFHHGGGMLPRLDEEESNESYSPEARCRNVGHQHGTGRPIRETLEEARGRLRFNMERKMERVRKNVLHIRESSSVYVHNIRESSSQAAHRMRAGMAVGVTTVKHQLQSFKELCGTGDMGCNTISMVSVQTDVDSNQQSEVVKQITFV